MYSDQFVMWLIVASLFVVGELVSPGMFYALSLAVGATAAMISALWSDSLVLQMVVCLMATVVSLPILRRFVRRYSGHYHHQCNVYALVGKHGVVQQPPTETTFGYVKIGGELWACKSEAAAPLIAQTSVIVIAVKGSHVIVRPV